MRLLSAVAISAITFLTLPGASFTNKAQAQTNGSFENYLQEVARKARSEGVKQQTLDRVLPTLSFNPRVIELDKSQPGGQPNTAIPPFAPYKARHVDSARINGGRSKYGQLASDLRIIEQNTGVPGPVIMAIYGHETNYGSYTGDFDIPRSLATLAYEGRRRDLFEAEFIAALKMIDRGVSQSAMKGSWAGAMGKPQFLPSVYLQLAIDGSGDGYADIWNNEADAVASIANYFVNAGWQRGVPWGVAVRVPSSLNRASLVNRTQSTRCDRVHDRHSQWKTMQEWRQLGVVPTGSQSLSDDTLASLLEPDGQNQTAYLLTGNYRVILDYNCSNFYALSVGLLADEIRK